MALVAQITNAGVVAPEYADVLAELQTRFRAIYGQDVVLDADTADGQWVALIALAIHDANSALVSAFAQFSPATASGEGLSSVVKVNGIRRNAASRSTVDLRIVGQAGTTITGGVASDAAGNRWSLPASVVIPPAGEITVTATADKPGAIVAAAGAVTQISTPTLGWQTVSNPLPALPGADVETDASLRTRQTVAVAAPARSVWDGLRATIAALPGVTRWGGVENDTRSTDAAGVPGNSVALVIEGGDAQAIGSAILLKKAPGTGTHGSTAVTVADAYGVPRTVRFSRPTPKGVYVRVTIKALAGYETRIGDAIKASVARYINGLAIGDDVILTRLYLPAALSGAQESALYQIVSVETGASGTGPWAAADVVVAYSEVAQAAGVVLVVQ